MPRYVPGSPTRSAGSKPSPAPPPTGCCRWSRTPAGSSTPSCWCSPSAAACASTRSRWTGSTTWTAGCTCWPPPGATCAAYCGRAPARRHGGNPAVTEVDELVRPDATPLPPGPVRARGWLTGREHDPRWVRPALLALLAGTAALYILGLGANGWANSFYTAAVQAGTQSWKAFFFGSFDAANFITVDKPPGSLWLTGLSARMFGVNAWSILVPQALAGVEGAE